MSRPETVLLAALCAAGLAVVPCTVRADWDVGADARWRHDDNVGNARTAADVTGDSITSAKLSIFRFLPLPGNWGMTIGADLAGEYYDHLHGLSNASVDALFALRKKWGLGAFAPWMRLAVSAAHADAEDDYRNASIYRSALSAGRRLDERWNVSVEYAFEHRHAPSHPGEEPGISGDAFSQTSHTLTSTTTYACNDDVYVSLGLSYRHGDVVSTTREEVDDFAGSRAQADDPAFGQDRYAYRLVASSYAVRLGIRYNPTPHHSIGIGWSRFDTHADGGEIYTKSVPEITWDYRF